MMSSESRVTSAALALIAVLSLGGCAAEESPIPADLNPPDSLTATAISLSGIRVDWSVGGAEELDRYRIERRANFSGEFTLIADVEPTTATYFDSDLSPETDYGYRLVAVNRTGERSKPSTVAGARTAPLPGLIVRTSLGSGSDPVTADANGYRLVLTGPQDSAIQVGTIDERLVSPLPAGTYTITLEDVAGTCQISPDTLRQVVITDVGLATRSYADFVATCVDANRGRVVAEVTVQGDSTDPDGYLINYAGILPGNPTPVLGAVGITGTGGRAPISSLAPGDYQFTLDEVDAPCLPSGPTTADVQVAPLSDDTVRFAVVCPNKVSGNAGAPLVARNQWNPQTAANGQSVVLDVALDLTALPGTTVGVFQASLDYDPAVLTYQSAVAPAGSVFGPPTVNSATPGHLTWLSISASQSQPGGVLPMARMSFRVAGTAGASTATRTLLEQLADLNGGELPDTLFRVVEDTFTVSAGGGSNQAPVAEANGPYAGAVGGAIAFSVAGSSDPDGTIASYSWAFGDGTTSTQANPSKSYAAAGTFTATLTVTDNQGTTDTDQASVTITGGGGNQAPVARANGPYAGTAGNAITFTSAGSSDPDGTIASYLWDFGDGTTSALANPTKSYASAGAYTASLLVTDNQGGTASSQATVTVAAPGSPITWASAFGAFNAGLGAYPLTITLNLSQDLAQTAGFPEAVSSYVVDSLVWDPAVLEYHSLVFASGGGSFNTTNAVGGCKCKLSFSGSGLSPNTGVVSLATVNFRPKGTSGSQAKPRFYLGVVQSTPTLGSFNYGTVLQLVEGSITLP